MIIYCDTKRRLSTRFPTSWLAIFFIVFVSGCAELVEEDSSQTSSKLAAPSSAASSPSNPTEGGFLPSNRQVAKKPASKSSANTNSPGKGTRNSESPATKATTGPTQPAELQESAGPVSTPSTAVRGQGDDIDAFKRLELAKQFVPRQAQAAQLAQAGRLNEAQRILEQIVTQAPFLPNARYNYACLLAQGGNTESALEELAAAVENGFTDVAFIKADNDLASLRDSARYAKILNRAKEITSADDMIAVSQPAVIKNQIAMIGPHQAAFDTRFNMIRTSVDWSRKPNFTGELPTVLDDEVGQQLREWYAERTAAGNWGDLYDNCDRNHSRIKHKEFPTLTRLQYDKSIKKSIPYGLQTVLWHNGVVIGNSSTASTGNPLWRSNTRRGYCSAAAMQRLHKQYRSNHLYVYPEHTDYDLKHGDVFPANTPYVLTSNGSSGSDKPFLNACVCALAAFNPKVKKRLVEENLIAPTLQYLVRQSYDGVTDDAGYLSRKCHEPVLNGKKIDRLRLIRLAHDMRVDTIPPLVKLRVEEEDQGKLGVDYFDFAERTRLFDTPQAIARVYRTLNSSTRIVISAEDSEDINGYPLKFEWVVLNADPATVKIKPLAANSSRVEIIVPYTPKRRIRKDHNRETARLDIGVFAHNGKSYSAPAFVTYFTLANEDRRYDADGGLLNVTYKGGTNKGPYVDPMIDAPKSWRDDYRYSKNGDLLGWTRTAKGKEYDEFTRDGYLVKEKDSQGRPTKAVTVRYFPVTLETRPMVRLSYEPTTETKTYVYSGPGDKLGKVQ